MIEPAMLLFGAATFAGQFGLQLPLLAGVGNAEMWSGAAVLLWSIVAIWLAWWTPRELVGRVRGAGRFWKWLGYSICLGFVSALPPLVSGFMTGFSQGERLIDWRTALISVGLQSAMILLWVRVYALAISGDRIRFADIRDALSGRLATLLAFFAPTVALSWAVSLGVFWQSAIDSLNPYLLAGTAAAIQAIASGLMTAVLVVAYLEVDRSSDLTAAREVFQ